VWLTIRSGRGASAYARAFGSDVADWLQGRRDPLVPPRYRLYAGWRGDYGRVAGRWAYASRDLGQLAPSGRVLDIGCGPGRIAAHLARHLEDGSYEGFDIAPRSIRWCQRRITPRHPGFRFQLADIRNPQYNRTGSQEARNYDFPYSTGEFDLALAASVFTHMRPGEIARYISEAGRVLKPGGLLLASFFLLNEDTQQRVLASGSRRLGEVQSDDGIGYRSDDPRVPEHMIAVFEPDVREMYDGAGLVVESIHYGKWCGRRDAYLGFGQDLVVARRRASSSAHD
jgi:SAM-dependent methyltransferase